MSFEDRLKSLVEKHSNLGEKLSQGANVLGNEFSNISKEYSHLSPIVELIEQLWASERELIDVENIINSKDSDAEFKQMAKDEAPEIRDKIDKITNDIKIALLPKDKDDDKSAILEIRAGTGGDEAALFVGDLFRMYTRYAETNKWQLELMSTNAIGIGGYKEVIVLINGKGVFAKLKYESGIHRVQRVPETEAKGRVHTSAVSVAVLPEVEEVDMNIEDKDLRIDIYRASGAGGQHVNTTESAVRITHIPTGIVVAQQDERSQHKNKAKAMKILASRLYEHQRREIEEKRSADRKSQIGSGDRSEKIRTYNFPQGRITDHRINLTLYKLDRFMEGDIEEVLQALIANDQAEKLSYIED